MAKRLHCPRDFSEPSGSGGGNVKTLDVAINSVTKSRKPKGLGNANNLGLAAGKLINFVTKSIN